MREVVMVADLSIRVTRKQKAKLEEMARKSRVSMSEIIRMFIDQAEVTGAQFRLTGGAASE